MKKLVVTGGAGFIGSNIGQYLLIASPADVVLVDSVLAESNPYLEVFRGNPRVEMRQADVRDPDSLKSAFAGAEAVFHCAAYARIDACIANLDSAFQINVAGTQNVLLAALAAGVRRVIYSGSASVYGKNPTLPHKEIFPPQFLNPYAATKYGGEVLCRIFAELGRLETVCLRYFNVYGSRAAVEGRAPFPGVAERFLFQKKNGQKLTIVGDGRQRRDFVYVLDVARANFRAYQEAHVGRGEVINIGAGKNYSVAEIAAAVGGETESVASRYEEPPDTLADITRARNWFDWEPTQDLLTWIKLTR